MRFASLLVLVLLGPLDLVAPQQPVHPPKTSVGWQGKVAGSDAVFKMTVEAGGPLDSGFLRLILNTKLLEGTRSYMVEDGLTDTDWSEWKVALPIRVSGERAPQVLAKHYRPNWLDIVVYSVTGGTIVRSFSFSCRSETAVKWNVKNGSLASMETFDRFESVPQRQETKRKPGYRWQVHAWHTYEGAKAKWLVTKRQWEQYKVNTEPPGVEIAKPSDCRFIYK